MNKKGISTTVLTLILIVISLVVAYGIWLIVNPILNQEPKYNITINECHNEADILIFERMEACNYGCLEYFKIFNNSTEDIMMCIHQCERAFNYTKEVCEEKEVQEIEGFFLNSCSGFCDCYHKYNFSCELKNGSKFSLETKDDIEVALIYFNNICIDGTINSGKSGRYCKSTIQKSNLTTSWLDENCECEYFSVNRKFNGYIDGKKENGKYLDNSNESNPNFDNFKLNYHNCGNDKIWYCSKYSCFDKYEVEVLR
jgi:hypothetical protein